MKAWRPSRLTFVPPPVPAIPERRSFLKKLFAFTAGGAALASWRPRDARADGDPWVGEIALVPYNFAPLNWATCDGQLLAISQNAALFNLIGTQFGGNGTTNFALPDLRSRVPVHVGQGPGLSSYVVGQTGGVESVTLLANQMPVHTHPMGASSLNGTTSDPTLGIPARNASGVPSYAALPGNANMGALGNAGGGVPHENRQPFIAMTYIISLYGIFPSRS